MNRGPGPSEVERVTGIEPAYSAWKAEALAIELHPQDMSIVQDEPNRHERRQFDGLRFSASCAAPGVAETA